MNLWIAIWTILDFAGINHEPPNPEVVPIVCMYDWDCGEALGIAWCESLHNPRAYNGHDHGLFQVNEYWWREVMGERAWSRRYTVDGSTSMAHRIWKAGGWDLWSCGR